SRRTEEVLPMEAGCPAHVALTLAALLLGPGAAVRGQQAVRLAGHKDTVFGLAVSADGATLASGSADQTAIIWDLAAKQPRLTFARHQSPVYSVALAPDAKTAASGGADNVVRLWDCRSAEERHVLKGHRLPVYCVSFSPDGKTLASASVDGTV